MYEQYYFENNITTRKCGIVPVCSATWGHLTPCYSFSALTDMPMPSLKSSTYTAAVIRQFYYWYLTLCCDLDLWPWTSGARFSKNLRKNPKFCV